MKLEETIAEVRRLSEPLCKFIRDNYDPYTTIIVKEDFVKIVEDKLGVPINVDEK